MSRVYPCRTESGPRPVCPWRLISGLISLARYLYRKLPEAADLRCRVACCCAHCCHLSSASTVDARQLSVRSASYSYTRIATVSLQVVLDEVHGVVILQLGPAAVADHARELVDEDLAARAARTLHLEFPLTSLLIEDARGEPNLWGEMASW